MNAVDLCNNALADLGHDTTITSLDPSADASREAARCALFWPRARREVFSCHCWAVLRADEPAAMLTPGDGVTLPGWPFAASLPADSLRVHSVLDASGEPLAFQQHRGALLLRQPADTIVFTRDSENPDEWPAWLQEAVTACLALKLARPMARSPRVVSEAAESYKTALAAARRENATDTRREPGTRNPYKDARA